MYYFFKNSENKIMFFIYIILHTPKGILHSIQLITIYRYLLKLKKIKFASLTITELESLINAVESWRIF